MSGIIISSSKAQAKARKLVLACRNCFHRKEIYTHSGFGGATLPKQCEGNGQQVADHAPRSEKCPQDPYVILGEECEFVDHQTLKLQEDPETIPTGEMPRQMQLSLEGVLVNKVVPGTRVVSVGVYTVMHKREMQRRQGNHVQFPYMKVVGLQTLQHGRFSNRFLPEEENEFLRFSKKEGLIDLLLRNVAPSIYGHPGFIVSDTFFFPLCECFLWI